MQTGASANIARVRIKVGSDEFEAEGTPEFVAHYFEIWQRRIATPASGDERPPPAQMVASVAAEPTVLDLFAVDRVHAQLALRRYPSGIAAHANAALLLLYGYRLVFGEKGQVVDVRRLKAALAASGHREARVARTLEQHIASRLIKKSGRRRGSAYELTPSGYQRAETLAHAMLTAIK